MDASYLADNALVPLSRTAQEPGSQASQQVAVFDPRPSQLAALAKLEQAGMTNAGSPLRSRHVRYHPYPRPASRRVGRLGWARDVDIATQSLVPAAAAVADYPVPIETPPEPRQPSQEVLELLRGPVVGTFNPVAAFGAIQVPPPLPQQPVPRAVLVAQQLKEEAQGSDSVSAFGHVWQQMLVRMAKQPQLATRLPQDEPAPPAPTPAPIPATAPAVSEPVGLKFTPAPVPASAPAPVKKPEPKPAQKPAPTPAPVLVSKPKPAPKPWSEEKLEFALDPDLFSDDELDFEDVYIPVYTPYGAPEPLSLEEEVEAVLALHAMSQGIDNDSIGTRLIKTPKSVKARIKAQPKPEPERPKPQAARAIPSQFQRAAGLRAAGFTDEQMARLEGRIAELYEDFTGFNGPEPRKLRKR